jgi:hypothetical protein
MIVRLAIRLVVLAVIIGVVARITPVFTLKQTKGRWRRGSRQRRPQWQEPRDRDLMAEASSTAGEDTW